MSANCEPGFKVFIKARSATYPGDPIGKSGSTDAATELRTVTNAVADAIGRASIIDSNPIPINKGTNTDTSSLYNRPVK